MSDETSWLDELEAAWPAEWDDTEDPMMVSCGPVSVGWREHAPAYVPKWRIEINGADVLMAQSAVKLRDKFTDLCRAMQPLSPLYTPEQVAAWLEKQAEFHRNRATEARMDGDKSEQGRRSTIATQLGGLAGFVRANGLEAP